MIPLEIEIVPDQADWLEIHGLLTRAFAPMAGRIDPPSSLGRLSPADLAAKAAAHACLTARLDGTLVGCLVVEDCEDALYLEKLAVRPDRQGQGIGRALVSGAERVARTLGKTALRLQTRVELVENHAAFAAMGFVEIGRSAHPGYDRPTSITLERAL